jgi:1-pyrroline-2-carboxylate reductase [NAD(P)H]
MQIISATDVHATLDWTQLITQLRHTYSSEFTMPQRQVMRLSPEGNNHDAFALLPSWNDEVIALKAFTYFPQNTAPHSSLYSQILLFDRMHGEPLALVEGRSVTFWRTAGISALASQLLSREDSETLLVLGTGNLAPYLIRAHSSVRHIKRVVLWGRNAQKAQACLDTIACELPHIHFTVATDLREACANADVIVSATGSLEVLLHGSWIQPGTHVDLLGNHHADHRECDSALVISAQVYVDTYLNCLKEAGEILIPIAEGVFHRDDIRGELADLCAGRCPARQSAADITLFKSVGAALGDLATAHSVYKKKIC